MTAPMLIGVSADTHARIYAMADEESHMGMDSLVNLALDAFEALREYTPLQLSDPMPPVSYNRFRKMLAGCRAGDHYCELRGESEKV